MAQLKVRPCKAQFTKGSQAAGKDTSLKRVAVGGFTIITNRDQIWREFSHFEIHSMNKKALATDEAPSLPRAATIFTQGNIINLDSLI